MLIFLFFLVGVFAGLLGGALGISGGVIIVPCLVFLFQKEGINTDHQMHLAIGTSLAGMILTSLFSTLAHQKKKAILWRIFFHMALFIIIGCFIGALIVDKSSTLLLKLIFAIFTICIGLYLLRKSPIKQPQQRLKTFKSAFLGTLVGFLSSLLGIGGGIISVPILTYWSVPEKNAIATSAATGIVTSIIGSLLFYYLGSDEVHQHASFGYIYLPAFIPIALAAAFFAPIGAKFAHTFSPKFLRKTLGIVLILISIVTIISINQLH